jgi:hypothetical protein
LKKRDPHSDETDFTVKTEALCKQEGKARASKTLILVTV